MSSTKFNTFLTLLISSESRLLAIICSVVALLALFILASTAHIAASTLIISASSISAALLIYGLAQIALFYWQRRTLKKTDIHNSSITNPQIREAEQDLQSYNVNSNDLDKEIELDIKILYALEENEEFCDFIAALTFTLKRISDNDREKIISSIEEILDTNHDGHQLLLDLAYEVGYRSAFFNIEVEYYILLKEYATKSAKNFLENTSSAVINTISLPGWDNILTSHWSEIFDDVIERGGNINILSSKGNTPLLWHVANHNLPCVKKLVSCSKKYNKNIDVNHQDTFRKNTALILACAKNHNNTIDMVEVLLGIEGIDINACDYFGRTALWFAYAARNDELIELLEAHGADNTIADHSGRAPTDMLYHLTDIDLLKDYPVLNEFNRDFYNRYYNNYPFLSQEQDLMDYNRNVEEINNDFDVVKLLLCLQTTMGLCPGEQTFTLDEISYSSSSMVPDEIRNQELLFIYTKRNDSAMLCKLLTECDIDIDVRDYKYRLTALHLAIYCHSTECIPLLLESGASFNTRSADKDPILVELSAVGKIEEVELSIANGADIDIENAFGSTPLLAATFYNHKMVVQLLLSKQPNPFKVYRGGIMVDGKEAHEDIIGKTPREIALMHNNDELATILTEYEEAYAERSKPVLYYSPTNNAIAANEENLVYYSRPSSPI